MKNYLIGAAVAVVAVLLFLGGRYTAPSSVNLGSYYNGGTAPNANVPFLVNDMVQGSLGWSFTINSSTAFSAGQFCSTGALLVVSSSASVTSTLPAATSTYALCGQYAGLGAFSQQLIDNESTNTVNVVAGTGTTFRCETQGVGTTSVVGGCTASQVSINPTSTAWVTGFWTNSSTQVLIFGNEYH